MSAGFDGRAFVPIIAGVVETPRPEPGREPWRLVAWGGMVLVLVVVGYASRVAGGDPPKDALYQYETAIGGVLIYGILLAVLLLIARGLPAREFFALHRPASWPKALGLSLLSYIVILTGAALILWALDAGDEQGLAPEDWDPSRAGAYAANFVSVALVGPTVEELMYRGAGMTLLARYGPLLAVLVTGVAFGLGHGLVLALGALVLFGLVTAVLRLRTGSIYPCILVHCVFNATSLIAAVTT